MDVFQVYGLCKYMFGDPIPETGNTGRIIDLGVEQKDILILDLDMLILRYLWNFQVDKSSRQLASGTIKRNKRERKKTILF